MWRAGGDILLMTTVNLKDWTTPTPIFTEEEDGTIPKVISNPPVEVGGHWVLPYWRQNPRGVSVCQVCDLLNQLPERERESVLCRVPKSGRSQDAAGLCGFAQQATCNYRRKILSKSWEKVTSPKEL